MLRSTARRRPHGKPGVPPGLCPRLAAWPLPAALALSGCGLATVEDARVEAERAAQVLAERRAAEAAPRYATVRTVDGPYVGLEPLAPDPRARLPERWRAADAVTLPLADIGTAAVLAARIEAATGLAVRLVGAALPAEDGAGPPAHAAFGAAFADGLSPGAGVWTGPLDRLLDAWAEAAGQEWRYDIGAGRLEIVRSRSVVFRVHALAGTQRHEASASSREREGQDGAAHLTAQSIAAETAYDPWPEIEAQAQGLVGPGTRVTAAPSSASVTVSGLPRDVRRVRRLLAYLNREVLRPVTLSAHVYSVRFDRESDYALGLAAVIPRLLGTSLELSVTGDSVAVARPGAAAGDSLAAAVRALAKAGTVSRVLSADVPSLNGKPAQFFELVSEAYLKELRTTAGEGVAQTELVPGTVSSGFALSYVPRITGPDEVLVRLTASLRDRPVFTEFTSDARTIQLPVYGSRAVQVTRKLGRGETLLVTGFSDRSASSERSGTFGADVPLPGGRRRGTLVRAERVLLIAAEVGAPLGVSEVAGTAL